MRVTSDNPGTTLPKVKNSKHQSGRHKLRVGRRRLRVAIAVGLAGATLAGPAAAKPCAPWPGEPDPLPRRDDTDAPRARWAALRATDLASRARALEAVAPLEAHQLWQRLRCFQAEDAELREGLERTRPLRVHRLEVVSSTVPEATGDPFAALALPISQPPQEPPVRVDLRIRLLGSIDRWLERTEGFVAEARFKDALAAAGETRRRLAQMRWNADLTPRWVRLEVLEATVQIARGREEEAHACAARALANDPTLLLDASGTSPKVVQLFDNVAGRVVD